MAKATLNPMFEGVSGAIGDLIFREVRGRTVISRRPIFASELTENQIQHRERFNQAVAYSRSALADPDLRPMYEAGAKSRNIPLFAAPVADFFNEPVIHTVNVFGYSGNVGDTITVRASDDFGVVRVLVALSDDQGGPIENGEAVETSPGSGEWVYTATMQSSQPLVNVQVVAQDRPGGATVMSINKTF
jgi:hypothetical protein